MGRPIVRQNPWLQVFVFALVGLFAYIDRQFLVLLIEPVKRDLRISDTEVSLLIGPAFVVFYCSVALPLARLADRWSRKGVIMLGVAVWGLMTCACGFAGNFALLLVARLGVGFGEAAFSPAAFALTAETIPAQRWGLALGALMLGAAAGYGFALLGGAAIIHWASGFHGAGWLAGLEGWQLAFVISGLLTLLTLIPLALLRPTARTAAPAPAVGWGGAWRRGWQGRGAYAAVFLGIPPASLAVYGLLAWLPSYLIRSHALSPVTVGVTLGLIAIVFGSAGIVAGALAIDRLGRSRPDAPIVAGAVAIGLTGLSCLLLLAPPSPATGLAFASGLSFAVGLSTPIAPVALQLITHDRDRAQVTAVFLLVTGLLGMGAGPLAVALLTDRVFGADAAVGAAMAVVGLAGCGLSVLAMLWFRPAYGRRSAAMGAQNSDG